MLTNQEIDQKAVQLIASLKDANEDRTALLILDLLVSTIKAIHNIAYYAIEEEERRRNSR